MARNELTSKRISTIAGRILRVIGDATEPPFPILSVVDRKTGKRETIKLADIKMLAASCLTQSADKPKRKRTKNVKKRSK